MSFISKAKAFLSGATSIARPGKTSAAYMRGESSPFFFGWRPALREARDDVRAAWPQATARAVDMIQNSGWIAGAIEQAVANTIGTGLTLNLQPDADALGWSEDVAGKWARRVERRFEAWSRRPVECDVEGRRSFGKMQAAALRQWFATGEVVAELPFRVRPGGRWATKVRLVPSFRLSNETDLSRNLVQGVRMDGDGFPVAYRFRVLDAYSAIREVEVEARDNFGRPRIVHVFDGATGQVRGITPLAPALRVARQFDQLADATLTAALLQTVFAATIESGAATDVVLQGLQDLSEQGDGGLFSGLLNAKGEWYEKTKIDLANFGKIAHLMPGESLKFHSAEHPSSNYRDFALFLLRELAKCLGLTFESTTGDYQGATYSSVRIATAEVFEITKLRREHVIAPFCQAAFEAWLEEAIDRGEIEFPGGIDAFVALKAEACRASWRGPARPQADDLKTAKAHEVWRNLGVITDEAICADLGFDVEDVYAQRAREKAMREEYGIEPEPPPTPAGGGFDPLTDEAPSASADVDEDDLDLDEDEEKDDGR